MALITLLLTHLANIGPTAPTPLYATSPGTAPGTGSGTVLALVLYWSRPCSGTGSGPVLALYWPVMARHGPVTYLKAGGAVASHGVGRPLPPKAAMRLLVADP